ncbi:hypothetical protein HDU82_004901 [Entophlyctis luteolus]|nr:hypothetical protein HDU82_004901 [Entophlyctis luteolus]
MPSPSSPPMPAFAASLLWILCACSTVAAAITACELAACQAVSNTANPLANCPANTILVSTNKSKYPSAFSTVQSAVASLPNNTVAYQILILSGNYTEQVNVTRTGPLYLLGQTTQPSNRTFNTVQISWAAWAGSGDDAYTATLTVAPNLAAALTGSGPTGYAVPADNPFGNSDFRAYNIDFINNYKPYAGSPSLALSVGYANTGFYRSRFYSYQDTIYVGKLGNAYFYDNEIAGETDFLYGFGTAWIQSSQLTLRSCGGGITAWKGTNTTFANKYGVYIHDSSIQKANSSLKIQHKCALGRPWNASHRSLFTNTSFDDSILPGGYIKWSSSKPNLGVNTTMAVYADYGAGYNLTALEANAGITTVFTASEYAAYSTTALVFQYPFNGTWSKIRHSKGANDVTRAKLFSKLSSQITNAVVAGKGETDTALNMYLAAALAQSRAAQMPKSNIEAALKKGIAAADGGKSAAQGDVCVYEGMSAQNVACVVVALSANRNKTFAEVRHCFTKNEGSLTSVMFNFAKQSRIVFGNSAQSQKPRKLAEMIEAALEMDNVSDFGEEIQGDAVDGSDDCLELICELSDIQSVQKQVLERGFDVKEMDPTAYIPVFKVDKLSGAEITAFEKLLVDLENQSDVIRVFHNAVLDIN